MNKKPATQGICTDSTCGAPLSEHIGGRSCVVGRPASEKNIRTWRDLPSARGAWRQAGRNR